jgi:hypothetical protein
MLTSLSTGWSAWFTVVPADRHLANGQCMAFERLLLRRGRHVAGGWTRGRRRRAIGTQAGREMAGDADGHELPTTRVRDAGRHLAQGPIVGTWRRTAVAPVLDLGVVLIARAATSRLLVRRYDVLDVALLAMRLSTLFGTAGLRTPWSRLLAAGRSAAAAASPGVVDRRRRWRGRRYG